MKTTFLKIATAVLLLVAGNQSFANTPTPKSTELTWITNFYKIEVHGNVQLHLISGDKTEVMTANSYFDHNALVQVEHGVLRITCYCRERLNVWVTVNDLRELTAYDNVLIATEGKFSDIALNIELFNKAKADMNLDCFEACIKLNDKSMADISGRVEKSDIAVNYAATLNTAAFVADEMTSKRIDPVWQTTIQYIATDLSVLDNDALESANIVTELNFISGPAKQIKFEVPAGVDHMVITEKLVK